MLPRIVERLRSRDAALGNFDIDEFVSKSLEIVEQMTPEDLDGYQISYHPEGAKRFEIRLDGALKSIWFPATRTLEFGHLRTKTSTIVEALLRTRFQEKFTR